MICGIHKKSSNRDVKKYSLLLLFLCLIICAQSQKISRLETLHENAFTAYSDKDFLHALDGFKKVRKLVKNQYYYSYLIAVCYYKLNDKDNCVKYLIASFQDSPICWEKFIQDSLKFERIKADSLCMDKIKKATGIKRHIDTILLNVIDSLGNLDQKYRKSIQKLYLNKDTNFTYKFDSLIKLQHPIDSINELRLINISKRKGFPNVTYLPSKYVEIACAIAFHSKNKLNDELYKLIKKVCFNRTLEHANYCKMYDRRRILKSKPQLYGTQFLYKDGKLVYSKIKNVNHINYRRIKYGLAPIKISDDNYTYK